jgi:UDP-2,3-diacylglucosamine pyrophosphatase LpxH
MLSSSSPRPAGARPHAQRYRTVFISDLHLGTPGCKADCLLDFLQHVESEYLYLIGDVVDGWRLKKKRFWPERHSQILRALLARSRRGTRVVYLPGHHDEALRKRIGSTFAGVRVLHDVIHRTADGRRLLVIHGDAFDGVCTDMQWLALLGSIAYDAALQVNTGFNVLRRWLGFGYWPLSAFLKAKVKAAVNFVERYEQALAAEARRRAVAGVVCGHVHKPEIRTIDGVQYFNDGDWVESCSALVEHMDGRMELVHWAERRQFDPLTVKRRVAPRASGKAAIAA